GRGEVQLPIPIEIAHRDGGWRGAGETPGGLETSISVAQVYRDEAAGHSQVQHPIPVEVANRDGLRTEPGCKGPLRDKGYILGLCCRSKQHVENREPCANQRHPRV